MIFPLPNNRKWNGFWQVIRTAYDTIILRKGEFLIETTAERILIARKEQLAARAEKNILRERVWTEALDRLLTIYIEESELIHGNT